MPMFEDQRDVYEDEAQQARQQKPEEQDHDTPSKPIPITRSPPGTLSRRLSEESIRTELCEGPLPDSPPRPEQAFTTPPNLDPLMTSDRAELIERLKRGESPTWIPNRRLEPLLHREKAASPSWRSRPSSAGTATPALLSAAEITPEKEAAQRLQDGLNIERPRSALHSGDFTPDATEKDNPLDKIKIHAGPDATTPAAVPADGGMPSRPFHISTPWVATSPPRHYSPFTLEALLPATPLQPDLDAFRTGLTSLSSSLSSSFAYQPPTSPLVQSLSNEDDDDDDVHVSLGDGSPMPASYRTNTRRHTLTSAMSVPLYHSPYDPVPLLPLPSPGQRLAGGRRENALPYQAHQPRRSLTMGPSTFLQQPQTPGLFRPRRLSFAADTSPLQHASMVGSYEESILRGRMSTTPSKPLEFLAQIGVLGLGAKCKSSLRCPPHVTLRFSAVFYSYASTPHGRSKTEDGPSPYVGMVDLENGLPSPEAEQRSKRKQSRTSAPIPTTARELQGDDVVMDDAQMDTIPAAPITRAQRRRPPSCRAPPGGSYRIPAHGQLQIIIKNQNKTAVKLFLIPYDVSDMEPGTKTFIRQRSYSAGPIVDNVPELAALSLSERPILRYLVHLHICCPSRGRYYLYKSIRVVFANRVPDGKEKLRNELSFPEPRYAPYKPVRVMHAPMGGGLGSIGGPGAMLAVEKAYRRRSAGLSPLSMPAPAPVPMPVPMPLPGWRQGSEPEPLTYSKLSKGDVGSSPVGESLLSQRLRSLEVHKDPAADNQPGDS